MTWTIILFILGVYVLYQFIKIFFYEQLYKRKTQKYWRDNKDKLIFIYSNKRGWADFVKNNILPVLPTDTIIYNLSVDKESPISIIYNIANLSKADYADTRQPFIIKLTEPNPFIYSFSVDFNTLKESSAKADLNVQKLVIEKLSIITATNSSYQ